MELRLRSSKSASGCCISPAPFDLRSLSAPSPPNNTLITIIRGNWPLRHARRRYGFKHQRSTRRALWALGARRANAARDCLHPKAC